MTLRPCTFVWLRLAACFFPHTIRPSIRLISPALPGSPLLLSLQKLSFFAGFFLPYRLSRVIYLPPFLSKFHFLSRNLRSFRRNLPLLSFLLFPQNRHAKDPSLALVPDCLSVQWVRPALPPFFLTMLFSFFFSWASCLFPLHHNKLSSLRPLCGYHGELVFSNLLDFPPFFFFF